MAATLSASKYKFDAFLSYSHSDAAAAAAAIEDGLEKLARPWNRRRALNIYRDRSSQTATADLSGSLRGSLMQARWLVVLASSRRGGVTVGRRGGTSLAFSPIARRGSDRPRRR